MRAVGLAPLLLVALAATAGAGPGMHPDFALLSDMGEPTAGTRLAPAAPATCGACHDVEYIRGHSTHLNLGLAIDCFTCHIAGGPDSLGTREPAALVSRATSRACGTCHGRVDPAVDPLEIRSEYLEAADPGPYAATLRTGEIFSPERMSDTFLNLAAKATRTQSWDVHAARQLACTSCHTAANRPGGSPASGVGLAHLRRDPRSPSIGQYLERPDHRLVTAACTSCHEAAAAHPDLPYRERHLDALACQACHVPLVMAPTPRAMDWTVVTAEGGPRMEYRGIGAVEWNEPSTWYNTGYRPYLLPVTEEGRTRFAAHNAIARWQWLDGASGEPVATATVARAWRGEDDAYPEAVIRLLDTSGDGRLDASELILDTPAKVAAIAARLTALGVQEPRIAGTVSAHRLRHGIAESKYAAAACVTCHARESRLGDDVLLSAMPLPGGVVPTANQALAASPASRRVERLGDRLQLSAGATAGDRFVFGYTSHAWIDGLGLLLFLVAAGGVTAHAGLRFAAHRRRGSPAAPAGGGRLYMYSQYERLWHWLMALSIILLLLTGLQIRFPAHLELLAYPDAITAHNVLAVILVVNGFLSLFYHLVTAEIGQFIPGRDDLLQRVLLQARFYVRGMFRGEAHPGHKTPERKLNPLQQIAYVGLLNVLFPLQIITGALIWVAGRWPHLGRAFGGLSVVAPLHDLGSWIFLSFLVVHVYLTTTGHTIFSNLRAMVTGWETAGAKPTPEAQA